MGEYARKGGRSIKLGTCEDLYYVTRADIEALAASGWEGDGQGLRDYLACKACRVRLPGQPGEPAGDECTIGGREMNTRPEFRIGIDPDFVSALAEVDHRTMCHHAAGTNFLIPCPLGKDDPKVRNSGLYPHIMLSAEGLGNRRAIYRCPYCSAQFNLNGHPMQVAIATAFDDQWRAKFDADSARFAYLLDLIQCGMESAATV